MEMAQTRETKGPEGFGGGWSEVKLEWLRVGPQILSQQQDGVGADD